MENRRKYKRQLRELVAGELSKLPTIEKDGVRQVVYEKDGRFDYDLYRRVQTVGNKAKLARQWVPEEHIQILSSYLQGKVWNESLSGVCHGTRSGKEQAWFRACLSSENVFGTEISDTAEDFEHTIQWDFHDTKDEWKGAFDFVYSNSWDHAFDPKKAFTSWVDTLKPGGVMLLDHGMNYDPSKVDGLDPLGMTQDRLVSYLEEICGTSGKVVDVLDGGRFGRNGKHRITTVVFQANAA
ncbi:class I SAM-dependent methyltransferase [Actibacterium pelagium]|uniref:Methyltransferase domain-containing protein n=1 Tax=Actibacterium pelagium TaxID=2029103 RepID=A0A917ANU9_9RHOB|nr:class I SAM-dependent methyltransferase [Actibacterium pelagium]GGE63109.1 hypothetical protein GCM10011517_33490 [Actibacterium pelagium]